MKTPVWPVLACLALTACPGSKPQDVTGQDAGPDASVVQTSCSTGFCVGTLDPTPDPEETPLAIAVKSDDTVAVAYYQPVGNDAGYEIHYLEYANGKASAPEKIPTGTDPSGTPRFNSERLMDLSLAIGPNGEPEIAFLGGYSPDEAFWFQNDLYLATRSGGSWSSQAVVQLSGEATFADGTPTPLVTNGFVVGVDPSIAVDDSGKTWIAYRDVQNGQFPSDWAGSDHEIAFGTGAPSGWTKNVIVDGEGKLGYGGHSRLVIANGVPTVVGDLRVGSFDSPGQKVYFSQRQANGFWTAPKQIMTTGIANDQSGPSYAYDSQEGYAVAVVETSSSDSQQPNGLYYVNSANGSTWNDPDPILQLGTGGWWPSLAFDGSHTPYIAYYFCDGRTAIQPGSCRTSDDELRLTYRDASDTWQIQTVDSAGGQYPHLAFLHSGKPVVVYRDITHSGPTAGTLKIAVGK